MREIATALRWIEGATLSIGILSLAAVTITNVLVRSVAGRSLAWAEEMAGFILLWVTFFGLAEGARRNRHIRMTALVEWLSEPARRRLEVGVAALTSLFFVFLAVVAAQYVAVVGSWGAVSAALRVPLAIVYLCAPIGCLAAAAEYAIVALSGGVADEDSEGPA